MEKITFVNENEPYLSAENLNKIQDNTENAIGEVNSLVNGLIESGENENGAWMKFANGTMICYGKKDLGEIQCTIEWEGLYYGTVFDVIKYPQNFAKVEHLEITAIPTTSATFWTAMGTREYPLTGYSAVNFVRPSSATIHPLISYMAVGKWK